MAAREITDTTKAWDRLHTKRRHKLNYPNEDAVRFLAARLQQGKPGKGLDVGCGQGRHMFLLRGMGFEPYGIDSSEEALAQAVEYGYTTKADMTELPFPDGMFDVVLCMGVAYYGTRETLFQTVGEIKRVLCDGGYAMFTLRSFRDWRRTMGAEAADKTVTLHIPDEPEDGMSVYFVTEQDVTELIDGWSTYSVEVTERTTHNMMRLESDFRVELQK